MRCVVLGDDQDVALTSAARTGLQGVDMTVVWERLTGDALLHARGDVEILVIVGERTPVTRDVGSGHRACVCSSPPACATPRSTSRRPPSTARPHPAPAA